MNWRRGLQRAYLLATVAWIAIVLFTVLSGRWEPWMRFHFTQGALSLRDIVPDEPKVQTTGTTAWRVTPEDFLWGELAKQRWEWAVGLSLFVPLAAYLILFYVVPWVFRGFSPGTQK